MSDIGIRILGTDEVVANLRGFTDIAERKLGSKLGSIILRVAFDAKSLAPFRTGFLRDNISVKLVKKKGFLLKGIVRSAAPYSIYQEFGTVNHSAHPFLIPAVTQNKQLIINELGRGLLESTFEAEGKREKFSRSIL